MSSVPLRSVPGTRPAQPVRVTGVPADWMCTWSYRQPRGGQPFWELKFIHAACPEHARLAAA